MRLEMRDNTASSPLSRPKKTRWQPASASAAIISGSIVSVRSFICPPVLMALLAWLPSTTVRIDCETPRAAPSSVKARARQSAV